jgi:O-antigen/teichoic acid export membrane protein
MKVGQRALRSTVFVSLNSYASFAITTISSIIMARLLLPEDFGVIALANFFLALFGRIKEFGLDYALIHRQDDLDQAFKTHFTLQVGLSLVNWALILAATPFLAREYAPEVLVVINVLAVFNVLKSASTTPRIFLEKELRFGWTTIVDLVALTVSATVGIIAALLGFGLWSLVILNVSAMIFTFVLLVPIAKWPLKFSFDKTMMSWFFKFGFFLWIGGVTTFIIFQYNDFVIGTFLSVATLGFYTKDYQFAQLPTTLVTSIVSRVALPTYSKLQSEKEKLSIAFNLVLRNIFRVSVPLSLLLFLVAEDFVHFLLGERWLPMVPLLQLLIVYSLLRPIFDDLGAFLTAIGKPQVLTKYLALQAVILLILTPILVWFYQANGAALSLDITMLVGVLVAYFFANKHVAIHYRQVFLPTIVAAVLTVSVFILGTQFSQIDQLGLFPRLLVKSMIIGIAYIIFIYLLEKKSLREDVSLFKEVLRKPNA